MSSSVGIAREWIEKHLKAYEPRSRSLIVTLFGDSVAPYSDGIWLTDLIDLMQLFAVNERLVRTSVFRLTEEGWIVARREGRRSYYTLAPVGRRRFQHAYKRVYEAPRDWDGQWTLVILPKSDNGVPERVKLRQELEWEGYGAVAPGIFLKPATELDALNEVLEELGLVQRVVVMTTREPPGARRQTAVNDLLTQCWTLDRVVSAYNEFLATFRPIRQLIEQGLSLSPEDAFTIQILLIDAFRRVTLYDPKLPVELLGPKWPGRESYALCRSIYEHTFELAREYLGPIFTDPEALAIMPPVLLQRFGGLSVTAGA